MVVSYVNGQQYNNFILLRWVTGIHVKMTPTEFIEYYNLQPLIHNNWLYVRVDRSMYVLPQSGQIAHDDLKAHLKPFGYKPTIILGL